MVGTSTLTIVAPVIPAAPTSLSGSKVGKKVQLTWTDNATNETGFYVQYSLNGGTTWTTLATLAPKSGTGPMSYTTGPLSRGSYSFQVIAFNGTGLSNPTNKVTINL